MHTYSERTLKSKNNLSERLLRAQAAELSNKLFNKAQFEVEQFCALYGNLKKDTDFILK